MSDSSLAKNTSCSVFKIVTAGVKHINKNFNLQAEIFHKPLIPQEVARHVSVSIVDKCPQAQMEQLQVHPLHCWIQSGVLLSNIITTGKKRDEDDNDQHAPELQRHWAYFNT